MAAWATAIAAVACIEGPRPVDEGRVERRLELLDRAIAVRSANPEAAVRLFADAGPGATLERFRLEGWLEVLEASSAGVAAWREAASFPMPQDLQVRTLVGLARVLVVEGQELQAVEMLRNAPDHARPEADRELIGMADGPWRVEAAARMAVSAPRLLRQQAPELERSIVDELEPELLLQRAAAWRRAGSGSRCASELRRQRWSGALEDRRRIELARCEVVAGRPGRAVDALRGVSSNNPEAAVVHGLAYRQRGWQRWPRSSAAGAFATCLSWADRALDNADGNRDMVVPALELKLECGTETGRPAEGLSAWWRLHAMGWENNRRDWLGRRLGVELARREGTWDQVHQLASALPDQDRCLGFWAALGADDRDRQLMDLASVGIPDLYARWAGEILAAAPTQTVQLAPTVVPAPPPESVAWLIRRDAPAEALEQWRRLGSARGTWPAEGLAEAELAESAGRRLTAIRTLRAAIPELGGITMDRAPANAVHAYLPLQWRDTIRTAARESGVDPWWIAAVARQESAFLAHARSPRGAVGVMQLLPGTARAHARALGFGSRPELGDPEVNIRIGARELARLIRRFGEVEPALAAYNAGETRVRRWWRQTPDRYRFTESVPIPETYTYIRRVSYLAEAYRLVYAEEWRSVQ